MRNARRDADLQGPARRTGSQSHGAETLRRRGPEDQDAIGPGKTTPPTAPGGYPAGTTADRPAAGAPPDSATTAGPAIIERPLSPRPPAGKVDGRAATRPSPMDGPPARSDSGGQAAFTPRDRRGPPRAPPTRTAYAVGVATAPPPATIRGAADRRCGCRRAVAKATTVRAVDPFVIHRRRCALRGSGQGGMAAIEKALPIMSRSSSTIVVPFSTYPTAPRRIASRAIVGAA